MITQEANTTEIASEYIGLHEYHNRQQLKDLLNIDPVRTEWCAAFINSILELDGIPNLNDINHKYPLTARAFLDWGQSVDPIDIQQGDLVIFPRGKASWQGHVGFYVGTTEQGRWLILGGNQDNTVSYKVFNPNKALGIRRWSE